MTNANDQDTYTSDVVTDYQVRLAALDRAIQVHSESLDCDTITAAAAKFEKYLRG